MKTKTSHFHKKIYKKLDSSPLSQTISPDALSPFSKTSSQKKIIPTLATTGLREEFKKTFLPLLIDIFELRQITDNHKTAMQSSSPIPLGKTSKTPQEILKRLEELQEDIEESKRWCEGVIVQIERGIKEAKETLSLLNKEKEEKKTGLLKRLLRMAKK